MRYPHINRDDAVLLPEGTSSLFYWMPKTAGTSMRDVLLGHFGTAFVQHSVQTGCRSHPATFDPNLKCATFWHSHIPSLVECGYIPAEWAIRAFGFAFVRNPWDRMVSLYHYFQKTEFRTKLPATFKAFIEAVVNVVHPRPGFRSALGYYQTNILLEWLRPGGVWLPKFIGKFETLQEDWDTLSIILGLPARPLPHRNRSSHTSYRDYYVGGVAKAAVALHFAEEIDIFGYTFN